MRTLTATLTCFALIFEAEIWKLVEQNRTGSMTGKPNGSEVTVRPKPLRGDLISGSVPSGDKSASASDTHSCLEEQMMWSRHQDKLLDMKHRAGFGIGPRNYATKEAEAQCDTPTRTESQQNDSLQRFHLLNVTGQFFSISSKPLPTLNIFSLFCCSAFRLIPSNWRRAAACQSGNILLPALEFRFYSQNHFEILCKPCIRVEERSSGVDCSSAH